MSASPRPLIQFKEFIRKIDPKSWPATFMFFVVMVAAGGLNYMGLQPIYGGLVAVAIAMFFGVGVVSWHIVESRTDDSEYQEDVAKYAKWGNVVLDFALIVVNLARGEIRYDAPGASTLGLDITASVIIGASALSHIVCYLLWTENDPRRAARKEHERNVHRITRTEQAVQDAASEAAKKLAAVEQISIKEAELRKQYKDLPPAQVDTIVRAMRDTAVASARQNGIDIGEFIETNGGGNPNQSQQQKPEPKKAGPAPIQNRQVYAYTVPMLLDALHIDNARALEMLGAVGNDPQEAWKYVRDHVGIPQGLTRANFVALCEELQGAGNPQ